MKKVSLILSAVVMTVMMLSSCEGRNTNNQYAVQYEPVEEYVLPSEDDVLLDWKVGEAYDQFAERYREQTPSFAGYFVVMTQGCGTCCRVYQIIDVRDGKVYSAPQKEEWVKGEGDGNAFYSRESSLFTIVRDNCGLGDEWSDTLFTHWDDNAKLFRELRTDSINHWKLSPDLSIVSNYRVGDIKEFVYQKTPEVGSDDWGLGVNVGSFYPIGWSLDGKLFAYRYGSGGPYSGGSRIFVFNVINDKIIDEMLLDYFDMDSERVVQEQNPNGQKVNDFLINYQIAPHFDFSSGSSFTSKLTNQTFNFHVRADKQLFRYGEYNKGKIDISVNGYNKTKNISTVKYEGSLHKFDIHGIIKSPFENRVIVLAVKGEYGYEGERDYGVQLFGCSLNKNTFDRN